MKDKPIQYFSKEYVEQCRGLTPDQILEFLDNFQNLMAGPPEKCQLISLKIEPSLLKAFKFKSKLSRIPYQTQIKKLMKDWVENG
jgi:predicted DNA binding CopG/RHH family protein